MKTIAQFPPHKQVEYRFYTALAAWLVGLIAIDLLPISAEAIQSLASALIAGGVSAAAVWMSRYAEPGDLKAPSRISTVTFTALAAALTVLLALAFGQGVGGQGFSAGLPFCIGLAAALTVLAPLLGLWAVRVTVAAAIGALAALSAGLFIGEREALVLLCQFAFAGAAFSSVMRRARELEQVTESPTPGGPPSC